MPDFSTSCCKYPVPFLTNVLKGFSKARIFMFAHSSHLWISDKIPMPVFILDKINTSLFLGTGICIFKKHPNDSNVQLSLRTIDFQDTCTIRIQG